MKDNLTKVEFDFLADSKRAVDRLDEIMARGGWWSDRISPNEDYTLLLIRLLHVGGIAVYERVYPLKREHSPETERRAWALREIMRKRDMSGSLYDIAELFPEDFDAYKTVFNSAFFPEPGVYVRCGALSPDRLFELLEQDGCEGVALFPNYALSAEEGVFYFFARIMPRDALLSEIQVLRDKRQAIAIEAMRRMHSANKVIPDVTES